MNGPKLNVSPMDMVAADKVDLGDGVTMIYQVVRLDETALQAIRQIVREEVQRLLPRDKP